MIEHTRLFADAFGITTRNLDRLLSTALAGGGDYADLYLEYRIRDVLTLEEGSSKAHRKIFRRELASV